MRNYGLIFGWIAALTIGAVVAIYSFGIKLGIDLSGGTILVYQIKPGTQSDTDTMNQLIGALQRRVNPEGVADIPIRPIGSSRFEIILAQSTPEEVERLKRKITDVGSLEFLILANYKHDARAAERIDQKGDPEMFTAPPPGYRWIGLGEIIEGGTSADGAATGAPAPVIADAAQVRLPGRDLSDDRYKGSTLVLRGRPRSGGTEEVTAFFDVTNADGELVTLARSHGLSSLSYYRLYYNPSEIISQQMEVERWNFGTPDPKDDRFVLTGGINPSASPLPEDPIIRPRNEGDGITSLHILVEAPRSKYAEVTGEYLARTYPTQDERLQPAVGFVFGPQGATRFGNLTRTHLPEEGGQFRYRLAVVLDDVVRSAPAINSEIRDSGIIEGVQPHEVDYLIEILRAGSLPATIDPTPLLEEKIGPTLGRDTISKGIRAIVISLAVVPLFMISYYRFAGVVAVIALLLNVLLLVASMAVTGSTFTLPGLAGLALTIGMAVDANVLIFERMREEKERGATIAQQIRNGFGRAWSAILDSNVTTILSAAVLWWVGTQEIKGFALTLIIGLLWNLFTAVYVSRVIFDFWLSRGWLKKMTMMKILGKTTIDFVGPRRYLMAASTVVITLGLIAFAMRGQSILNIDFTGGTLVAIRLNPDAPALKGMSASDRSSYVRETAGEVLPDVGVETLNLEGEEPGYRFNIRTTEEEVQQVQTAVAKAFGETLNQVRMTVGQPEPIAAAEPSEAATPKDEDEAKSKTTAKAKTESPTVAAQFAGGTRYPLTFNRPVDAATIRSTFESILAAAGVANPASRFVLEAPASQARGEQDVTALTLRTDLEPEAAQGYLTTLSSQIETAPGLLFDRVENFGAAVAEEMRNLAVVAIVLSWLVMIGYLWFRFQSLSFGAAAVIALVHDLLITLGAVAISPYKIDLPMVAAFLTLIGFSVNDTIVIFDRIRELRGKSPTLTPELINLAINQTLSRTFLTGLTAWIVVVIFYLFGGEGLRGFSFSLVVGFISGVYSTIYIAAPILIEWSGRGRSKSQKGKPVVATREV